MSILDLPTELILEVASYLDWAKEDLCPSKPDIFSLSATCSQIREAIIPLVFKDVTLRLRWQHGALVEPCLYKLRLHCPHLAQHIRSVCIRTNVDDDCQSPQGSQKLKFFVAPKERPNWLDLASDVCPRPSANDDFRERANAAALRLASSVNSVHQDPEMTAEKILGVLAAVESVRTSTNNNVEVDALAIAMLCVPRRTNQVVFVSLRQRDWSNTRNNFAARVAAATMNLLQKNIEDLTLVSNVSARDQRATDRRDSSFPAADDRIINPVLINTLTPRRLVFAMSDKPKSLIGSPMLSTLRLDVWHGVAHTVRALELKYICSDTLQLLQLIQGFTSLENLGLYSIALQFPRTHNNRNSDAYCSIWLSFCLKLRIAMRRTKIDLEELMGPSLSGNVLPTCAVAWIRDMAIPAGAVIDFERQERLLEDFESFLPLWAAEEEENRGVMALKEWDDASGRNLCDAAMSRRWR